MRIVSIIILVVFVSTQVAWGYEGNLRIMQRREGTNVLGKEDVPHDAEPGNASAVGRSADMAGANDINSARSEIDSASTPEELERIWIEAIKLQLGDDERALLAGVIADKQVDLFYYKALVELQKAVDETNEAALNRIYLTFTNRQFFGNKLKRQRDEMLNQAVRRAGEQIHERIAKLRQGEVEKLVLAMRAAPSVDKLDKIYYGASADVRNDSNSADARWQREMELFAHRVGEAIEKVRRCGSLEDLDEIEAKLFGRGEKAEPGFKPFIDEYEKAATERRKLLESRQTSSKADRQRLEFEDYTERLRRAPTAGELIGYWQKAPFDNDELTYQAVEVFVIVMLRLLSSREEMIKRSILRAATTEELDEYKKQLNIFSYNDAVINRHIRTAMQAVYTGVSLSHHLNLLKNMKILNSVIQDLRALADNRRQEIEAQKQSLEQRQKDLFAAEVKSAVAECGTLSELDETLERFRKTASGQPLFKGVFEGGELTAEIAERRRQIDESTRNDRQASAAELAARIGNVKTFEDMDNLYWLADVYVRDEEAVRRVKTEQESNIANALIENTTGAEELEATINGLPQGVGERPDVLETIQRKLHLFEEALLAKIEQAAASDEVNAILTSAHPLIRTESVHNAIREREKQLFIDRVDSAIIDAQKQVTVEGLDSTLNRFTIAERKNAFYGGAFSRLEEIVDARKREFEDLQEQSLITDIRGAISVEDIDRLTEAVPEKIRAREGVKAAASKRGQELYNEEFKRTQAKHDEEFKQKLELCKTEIRRADSDRRLNELEIELNDLVGGHSPPEKFSTSVNETKEMLDRHRAEIMAQQRLRFDLYRANTSSGMPEEDDICQLLLALCYPQKYAEDITAELLKLLKIIDFTSIIKDEPADADLVWQLHARLNALGYLSERRIDIPLYRLLVNGLDGNFIGEEILSILGRKGNNKELQDLVACSAISQLVYIILTLTGREVKTAVTLNHIFVIRPLNGRRVAFIDFATDTLYENIYKEVNLAERYQNEGQYLVYTDRQKREKSQSIYIGMDIDYSVLQVVDRFGATPAIFNNLADVYRGQLNRDISGLQACNKAITLNPHFVNPYRIRAVIYARQNKLDSAISDAEMAVSLLPSFKSSQELLKRLNDEKTRISDTVAAASGLSTIAEGAVRAADMQGRVTANAAAETGSATGSSIRPIEQYIGITELWHRIYEDSANFRYNAPERSRQEALDRMKTAQAEANSVFTDLKKHTSSKERRWIERAGGLLLWIDNCVSSAENMLLEKKKAELAEEEREIRLQELQDEAHRANIERTLTLFKQGLGRDLLASSWHGTVSLALNDILEKKALLAKEEIRGSGGIVWSNIESTPQSEKYVSFARGDYIATVMNYSRLRASWERDDAGDIIKLCEEQLASGQIRPDSHTGRQLKSIIIDEKRRIEWWDNASPDERNELKNRFEEQFPVLIGVTSENELTAISYTLPGEEISKNGIFNLFSSGNKLTFIAVPDNYINKVRDMVRSSLEGEVDVIGEDTLEDFIKNRIVSLEDINAHIQVKPLVEADTGMRTYEIWSGAKNGNKDVVSRFASSLEALVSHAVAEGAAVGQMKGGRAAGEANAAGNLARKFILTRLTKKIRNYCKEVKTIIESGLLDTAEADIMRQQPNLKPVNGMKKPKERLLALFGGVANIARQASGHSFDLAVYPCSGSDISAIVPFADRIVTISANDIFDMRLPSRYDETLSAQIELILKQKMVKGMHTANQSLSLINYAMELVLLGVDLDTLKIVDIGRNKEGAINMLTVEFVIGERTITHTHFMSYLPAQFDWNRPKDVLLMNKLRLLMADKKTVILSKAGADGPLGPNYSTRALYTLMPNGTTIISDSKEEIPAEAREILELIDLKSQNPQLVEELDALQGGFSAFDQEESTFSIKGYIGRLLMYGYVRNLTDLGIFKLSAASLHISAYRDGSEINPPVSDAKPGLSSVAAGEADAGEIIKFTTAFGSEYTVDSLGRTQRMKTQHKGHSLTDVGLKEWSTRTVYVDEETAAKVGGWMMVAKKYFRIAILNNEMKFLHWSEKDNKWVREGMFVFTTSAEVGKFPIEFSHPIPSGDKVNGTKVEWYEGIHNGNKIIKITTAASKPVGVSILVLTDDVAAAQQRIGEIIPPAVIGKVNITYQKIDDSLNQLSALSAQAAGFDYVAAYFTDGSLLNSVLTNLPETGVVDISDEAQAAEFARALAVGV